MNWFNRILSGARLSYQNRYKEEHPILVTGYVGPEQTPQVLNEIVEHVRANYAPRQSIEIGECDSALREFTRVYTINAIEGYDARRFLQDACQNITSVIRNDRKIKVKSILKCNMERKANSGTVIQPSTFHSDIGINLDGTDEKELYDTMVERMIEKMATFQSMGSGWRFHSIIKLELQTLRYNPLRGECYIPLPKELANKKAIINMKNGDNQCFLRCVLRPLNPTDKDQERVDTKLREKENTLNMKGIEYPVSLKYLNKFEKQNQTIFITVLGYERKSVYPLRNSDCTDGKNKIILMLIEKKMG